MPPVYANLFLGTFPRADRQEMFGDTRDEGDIRKYSVISWNIGDIGGKLLS